MSLFKQKGYRIVRTNKFIRDRYPKATRTTSPRNPFIRTICIIPNSTLPKQNLQCEIQQKNIILFNKQTYLQATFDKVLRTHNPNTLWPELPLKPTFSLKPKNTLILYLQQHPSPLFINSQLLNINKLQHPQYLQKFNQWGIVERTVKLFTETIDRQKHEQVLMSVVGFTQNAMVDLLNLDKEGKQQSLKICKEGNFINVANLTEMEIQSMDFMVNSLLYSMNYRGLHEKNTGVKIEAEVYQLSVCQLSEDQTTIQSIKMKCNLVKIHKDSLILKNSVHNCLMRIGKQESFMPTRNCKFTHFLQDCLNTETNITVISEIDPAESFKSQMDAMSFNDCTNGGYFLRKNYFGDQSIIKKLQLLANETQRIGKSLLLDESLEKAKSQKLGPRSRKISPALLSQTVSSTKKKISLQQIREARLKTQTQQQEKINKFQLGKLSGTNKNQIIRQLYKFT